MSEALGDDYSRTSTAAKASLRSFAVSMKPLAPAILGLAFARVAITSINPGEMLQSDGDMLTDWTSIVKCLPFVVMLFILLANRRLVKNRAFLSKNQAPRVLIVAEAICIVALNIVYALGTPSSTAFSIFVTMASALGTTISFFWVVQGCGIGPVKAVCYVAASRIASEPFLAAMTLIPSSDILFGLAGVAGQLACLRMLSSKHASASAGSAQADTATESAAESAESTVERTAENGIAENLAAEPARIAAPTPAATLGVCYFGGLEQELKDRRFLSACVLSCILLSMAAGLLRAFPDGSPIVSTAPIFLASTLLLVMLYAAVIMHAAHAKETPLTLVALAWATIELLGAISLVAYTFFPDQLAFGAGVARDFNDLLHAFRQYIVIALIGIGWRNPYYYAIATYLIFLLPRAFARTALVATASTGVANSAAVGALAAFLLVLAGMTLLVQIIHLLQRAAPVRASGANTVMEKILGIDQAASPVDMQQAAMERAAAAIGERFALSEREVEVLALFAQGHTQQRVADELFISKSTAHAHIQHIYTKTGLHSRQDILNYIKGMDEE